MKPKLFVYILLTLSLLFSSCNLPDETPQVPSSLATSAAQTVQAVLTPPADSAVTKPAPSGSPADGPNPVPPEVTPTCEDSATHTAWTRDSLEYDTKEANKNLAPNKTFTMSWTFKNTGNCTWDSTYQMFFDSGTPLTRSANFPILPFGATVEPGGSVEVDIVMTAPADAGEYQSVFSLQNDRGQAILNLGVITRVGSTSSQSLAKPGDLRYTYDCTSGAVTISLFWIDRADGETGYRISRDGTKVADLPAGSTSYSEFAPGSGKYNYAVTAFNAGGESSSTVVVNTSNC